VPSDPCLFCPLSPIKSSAMMVAEFCRGFLSGVVGNLTKVSPNPNPNLNPNPSH